jgi:fructosamine-3-kinase
MTALLLDRLRGAGLDAVSVAAADGGQAATAGIAELADGSRLFVKAFDEPIAGAFDAEAEGLAALREAGLPTPEVVLASPELLALTMLSPRPATEQFWIDFAEQLARVHSTTVQPRFGWHRDNWLGRRQQHNTWNDDGFAFFAENRLLRWLSEPRVHAAVDTRALERLCARLPELLPEKPAVLVHGDLWMGNVMATSTGAPAVIDPAVSYTWAEVDLAHLYTTAPPPEAAPFFEHYASLTGLDADWRSRMPIIQLRQHLAVVAQFEPDWGAAEAIRETLRPFS